MKQTMIVLLAALAVGGLLVEKVSAAQNNNTKTSQSTLPEPWLVQSVDPAQKTVVVARGKSEPVTYTLNGFSRVTVNGKAGKLEDVKAGMRVDVVVGSDGKTASRVDAQDYTPRPAAKKK